MGGYTPPAQVLPLGQAEPAAEVEPAGQKEPGTALQGPSQAAEDSPEEDP